MCKLAHLDYPPQEDHYMLRLLQQSWDRHTFARITTIASEMRQRFEWFARLEPDKQFTLASQLANSQKTDIQKLKVLLDVIPWIVALLALLQK